MHAAFCFFTIFQVIIRYFTVFFFQFIASIILCLQFNPPVDESLLFLQLYSFFAKDLEIRHCFGLYSIGLLIFGFLGISQFKLDLRNRSSMVRNYYLLPFILGQQNNILSQHIKFINNNHHIFELLLAQCIIEYNSKMENQKQIDDKLLAIMQFTHHYDADVSLANLLNGRSFYKLINHISAHQFEFNININHCALQWSDRLQNLQTILYKIQEYFQVVHQKSLEINNVDLIDLSKSEQLRELISYFEIVMALLMQSRQKQKFIQTIMMLQQSSQEVFVEIIKNSIGQHRFTKSKYKSNKIQKLINEFSLQKIELQKQIERLCGANMELLQKIKQYQQAMTDIQLDMSKRSSLQNSIEEGSNVKYLEEYIDKLQSKIVSQSKIYEEQKMGLEDKIMQMQTQLTRLEQAEELSKIYKEKYDDIMDQMQKMNIWKRQKAKMQKLLQEKEFMVQKLHDRLDQLTQKNIVLEQNQLQLKIQIQNKQIRNQKISSELKKLMENIGQPNSTFTGKICEASFLDQSLKQCLNSGKNALQDSLLDDQINQMKKQNQKLLKKNKQQEKQICKLSKKVQRLRILQQDKTKLQQLVFHLRVVQSEELNLMFSVFYEGFEENVQLSKKLKHDVLNFKEKQQIVMKERPINRKRTGLTNREGKLNWLETH